MKNKILKIVTAILLLVTLTVTNFIYVGAGLVSYAKSSIATNHDNVEFDAKLNDNNILSLSINVNKEGYFNGEIALDNSNFSFVPNQTSNYIHEIKENKIVLNQLNAGTTAQIDLQIEPINNEIFNIGLLNLVSKLSLTGIYRDSTEKNINIKAAREVKYEYPETNTIENLESTTKIITNKVMKVSGEDKRVVQLEVDLGLKENNYPIKDIELKMNIPSVDGKYPTIVKKIDLNAMTKWDYSYQDYTVELKFTNDPDEENNILWKKQGNEKLVLTLIFEKEAEIGNAIGQPNVKVTLYNDKQLSNTENLRFEELKEEKEAVVQVTARNSEDTIFKGKLYSGIDRQFESKTNIAVNLANAEQYIKAKEETTKYIVEDEEIEANVVYNKTVIEKKEFDEIFGQNGVITISNENNEIIATIDNSSEVDENNNIVVDYTGKEPSYIEIKTTTPVAEGNIEFIHTKTIKEQDKEIINEATKLNTKVIYEYFEGQSKEAQTETRLEESKTEAILEVNKETLSTIIENTVEMRAVLKGNNEQYNLYENPSITFELPEEVEEIKVNSLDLIYETELKIKNYDISGRTLTVNLEGKQTDYKNLSIEGAVLVINANVVIDKKAASTDSQITMKYKNQELTGTDVKDIRIVAPKDVTVINNIKELSIETIGQEEIKKASLQRGADAKKLETEIEVINNNENAIENVKILGTFPTRNTKNNIDIKIVEGISVEGAKVYYTENENATADLEDSNNAWKEEIVDSSKVKKYLIEVATMEKQANIKVTYAIEIPALLEYNQATEQGYSVSYTNTLTKTESEIKSTTIQLETGVGPKLETKLIPTVGETEATEGTVKNGEVIKYKIEVSNVGSEELTNITVEGNVPEGTTLVIPQDNYEYTGASYYKELEDKTYKANIEKIEVGEVATVEYEVRVNANVNTGTKLVNKAQIKYGDVIKESNDTEMLTSNGDLRISVKRVTDRKIDLYETGTVRYFAIIENISDDKQDNVKVKTNMSENLIVDRVTLLTGMQAQEVFASEDNNSISIKTNNNKEEIESKELQYNEKLDIGALEVGETKVLSYDMTVGKVNSLEGIKFSTTAEKGKELYRSNIITDNVKKADVSLNMTSNTQSQYVKAGDAIEYTITIKNNGTQSIEGLQVQDIIPNSLTVNKVSFDGEEITSLKGINNIEISCDLATQSESIIKIDTIVNYSQARTEAEPITNVAYAKMLGEKVATTSEINHIIEANKNDNTNTEQEENNSNNDVKDNDIAKGNRMITGIAWFDENANGRKDDNEKTLSNIKVHLLNTETKNLVKDEKGNILEAITNDNGVYVLNNIGNGKYVVIFDYNKTQFTLTKYKTDNVEETNNSDAMINELIIENEKQQVASTDILEINNENISGINIGLIELKDFSFKLDKYVSRILIQNSEGTTVKEYNDATVAKAELDGKKINGTTVIIEYKIKVTNIGEIDGYVRKIVDYAPSDLKFSSELNKEWYQTGNDLYNASLANERIAAGESREVKLTLTKAMTENNTGLINNTAEIAESYNELGIADSKSTSGNKAKGENDYGSADTILGLKTGGEVYLTIAIILVLALGTTAFIIIRKKSTNGDKE